MYINSKSTNKYRLQSNEPAWIIYVLLNIDNKSADKYTQQLNL